MARVLVVEDETIIALDAAGALTLAGFDVAVATTATDAMVKLDAGDIDLVLLDVLLNFTGAEKIAIRLHRELIPFVLATAYVVEKNSPWIEAAAVVRKPYSHDVLVATVRALLEKRSSIRQIFSGL